MLPSSSAATVRSPRRGRRRAALALPAAALAVVALAGCGGGSGSKAATAATSAGATAGTATQAAAGGAQGAAGFAAYAACLAKNGVTLPTGRPGGFARPSGAARPTGRPAGGLRGAFGLNTADPKTAAALKACAAERPTGGFGGANNAALQSQLTAYRSCLSDHGVKLPTPSADATPGARGGRLGGFGLGRLDTADPKTAAAVKACAPLRPTFAPRAGAPTPTVTPTT